MAAPGLAYHDPFAGLLLPAQGHVSGPDAHRLEAPKQNGRLWWNFR